MTHYEVLGVAPTASEAELRRAYLALVRVHHPDRHANATPAQREAAEHRMRDVNRAWHELGDPERRRRYDQVLDRRPPSAVIVGREGPSDWRPYDEDDEDDDPRLDDSDLPPPRGGRLLTMAPPAMTSTGIALVVVGIIVGVREVLAFGVMAVLLGAGLFIVVPLNVILESRRHDLD